MPDWVWGLLWKRQCRGFEQNQRFNQYSIYDISIAFQFASPLRCDKNSMSNKWRKWY